MQDDIEERLAAIWRDVIGLNQVGRDEDFFDICENSMVAMHLFEHMESEFGARVDIAVLLKYPTIASMSAYLMGSSGAASSTG